MSSHLSTLSDVSTEELRQKLLEDLKVSIFDSDEVFINNQYHYKRNNDKWERIPREITFVDSKKIDFRVGNFYLESNIRKCTEKNFGNSFRFNKSSMNNPYQIGKTAINVEFKKQFNVWFIFVDYALCERLYKCVYRNDQV